MRRFSIGDWRLAIFDWQLTIGDCHLFPLSNRQSKIVNRKSSIALAWCCSIGLAVAAPTVRELILPATGKTGFTRLESQGTGIHFTNYLSDERSITNRNLLSGAGVAAGDVDGDGWCDLFFCRLGAPSTLYRNQGNWTFKDVTEQAGVSCGNQDTTAAAFADLDGDGDLDLLVNGLGHGTRVFANNGKGEFKELAPQTTGLSSMPAACRWLWLTLTVTVTSISTSQIIGRHFHGPARCAVHHRYPWTASKWSLPTKVCPQLPLSSRPFRRQRVRQRRRVRRGGRALPQ